MSYEPTVWKDGDLVTSAKLNKLEQGVTAASNGIFIVNDNENVLDKTYAEIAAAAANNIVILKYIDIGITFIQYLLGYGFANNKYRCEFNNSYYLADSENEYPELFNEGPAVPHPNDRSLPSAN